MTSGFVAILFGMIWGVYAGYRIHRKWRLPMVADDERIGKMTHISDALDGYLERKMIYNEKEDRVIN